jgi:predicted dehydrogenase
MTYGIGVIGVGVWGCHSLEHALLQAGDARVVAVATDASMGAANYADSRETAGTAYAERLGAEFRSDWQAVVDDPAVDIVAAMVCPKRKAEIILAALAAGKHVVTDKPLAFTVPEAEQIVAAEHASAGAGFMLCGYHPRPLVAHLLDAIAQGRLGEIRAASVRFHFMGGIYPGFQPTEQWRSEIPSAEMTTIGSHALVTLCHLMEQPARTVYASTRNCFYKEYEEVGAEDWAELNLEFGGHAVGHVTVGRLPYRLPREDIRIEVTGTLGYAEIADDRLTIWPGEETVSLPLDGGAILAAQFKDFYQAIETDTPTTTTFAEGLHLQRILAAAQRSVAEDRPCSV